MPSHLFADRPAQPPEPGSVDALISQTRRLRGEVDAVRRDTVVDDDDAQGRWQRALCDLAVHHLDDLREHLGQLKEGLPPAPETVEYPQPGAEAGPEAQTRVGSAEWNLLTDEVSWSDELFQIFGRSPESGAPPLDELGSTLFSEDQPLLTAWVTACLVDGKPIDGEFRIVRADGRVRTLHMRGEPVLDSDGCTASMWAVLRDVSELRRSQRAVRESRDSLQRQREIAQTERRLAVELQEAVLPPWRGSLRFPYGSAGTLAGMEDMNILDGKFPAEVMPESGVEVNDMFVRAFHTPHDSRESLGYTVEMPDGNRIGIATDIGVITDELMQNLLGCQLVLLESNHDVRMLQCNPNYPYPLKRRILSDRGHLCNEACAEAAEKLVQSGTTRLILGHLSKENNLPQLAYQCTNAALSNCGMEEGSDYLLRVAGVGDPQMIVF